MPCSFGSKRMPRQIHALGMISLFLVGPAVFGNEQSTRSGKHFRIVCHFDNDDVAADALKTAEMVWPVATKLFALPKQAADEPFEIHLFRALADYERADRELTGGKFKRNLAFSHWSTQSAYILLQPSGSDEILDTIGIPLPTRRLIAHEAAHLVRYATLPNHRSHPHWLADGAASWVEEEVLKRGGWVDGVAEDPNMSTMILKVAKLIEDRQLPAVSVILRDRMDDVEWGARYAARWLLLRFMKDTFDADLFRSIVGEARRLGGGTGYGERLASFVERAIGDDEMRVIDEKFAAYVRAFSPPWEEVYRSLDTAGKAWTQIAFPDTNAIAWRTKPVGKENYTLVGRVKLLPGAAHPQMNLLLGRSRDGFLSVAFNAGGGVTIFNHHSKENRWENLGFAASDVIRTDSWIRFRAEVGDDAVEISLDRKPVLTASLNGRSMAGPWGLGAQSGSAGQWRKVTLK